MISVNCASQVVLVVKKMPADAGDARDVSLIPGLRRSPGGGNLKPEPYSSWERFYTFLHVGEYVY